MKSIQIINLMKNDPKLHPYIARPGLRTMNIAMVSIFHDCSTKEIKAHNEVGIYVALA